MISLHDSKDGMLKKDEALIFVLICSINTVSMIIVRAINQVNFNLGIRQFAVPGVKRVVMKPNLYRYVFYISSINQLVIQGWYGAIKR